MPLQPLHHYDITPERGFLTPYEMQDVTLPDSFASLEGAGDMLSALIASGRVRTFLNLLPEVDMAQELPHLDDAQRRLLMVRYSFLVQAYVWGEEEAATSLPRNLAVPYCALSAATGQFPLLPYASYTLDNWAKLDDADAITLDNLCVLQNFLGGQDENWFILVHVAIEAAAGQALAALPGAIEAVQENNREALMDDLEDILSAWQRINPIFDRMPERCDPYIYYHRVRPYIHGWKGNPALPEGLIYEGVTAFQGKPQAFRGQTGSQSSIVPAMDAFLGIHHDNDPLKEYLDELHAYRPPLHRQFIEDVRQESRLRAYVKEQNHAELTELYNALVQAVEAFRTRHLEYAADYIHKQARDSAGNPTDIGTGGTPFMKYLKKHRDESSKHLL